MANGKVIHYTVPNTTTRVRLAEVENHLFFVIPYSASGGTGSAKNLLLRSFDSLEGMTNKQVSRLKWVASPMILQCFFNGRPDGFFWLKKITCSPNPSGLCNDSSMLYQCTELTGFLALIK